MSDYQKDNRVVVTRGEYRYQHGRVIEDITGNFNLQRQYRIKLDGGDDITVDAGSLQLENLSQSEIHNEVANLKQNITLIATQLPDKMGTELPNHLAYLHDALNSKNQSRFLTEYAYITAELDRALANNSVTQEWWKISKNGLEKLRNYISL